MELIEKVFYALDDVILHSLGGILLYFLFVARSNDMKKLRNTLDELNENLKKY
jgi:hypothetical protein